ncbi:MAG: hypothetical protein ACKOSO_02155 [Actinomycetota bacterium]
MGARAGEPDARALLAASPRVRDAVPRLVEAAEPGQRVALVGGVGRDLARGEEPREVDVVVEGDGIAFAERLAALTRSEVVAYRAFGTATVRSRPPVDVAGARTEAYAQPGALPEVAPATLEADLARRDVTVTAVAAVGAGPDAGQVLDPHGGLADLAAGTLRLLRPDAFEEDATRIVRAARYAVRLGLAPDATLDHAARAAAHGGFVALTGGARMADALALVFSESDPAAVLGVLAGWGALDAIEPGLAADPAAVRAAWALAADEARDADRVALGLGLLLAGVPEGRRAAWLAAAGRDRHTTRAALAAARAADLRVALTGAGDAAVDRACAGQPLEAVVAAGGPEAAAYLGRLRHVALAVDGDDVVAAGHAGPAVGRELAELRAAVIEGAVGPSRDAQLAWLAARAG